MRSGYFAGKLSYSVAILSLLAVSLAACSRWDNPVATVPVKTNAAAQYKFAADYQTMANLDLISDPKRFRNERDVVRQTYDKVTEYFPADRSFTPLAKLDSIEIDVGLGQKNPEKLQPAKSRVTRAITQVQQVAKDYPENVYVQVKSKYLQGNFYKWLGDYPKAQDCFKEIMDKYKDNTNPAIKYLVQMSGAFYGQVYVK